jgi:hypothetical protein
MSKLISLSVTLCQTRLPYRDLAQCRHTEALLLDQLWPFCLANLAAASSTQTKPRQMWFISTSPWTYKPRRCYAATAAAFARPGIYRWYESASARSGTPRCRRVCHPLYMNMSLLRVSGLEQSAQASSLWLPCSPSGLASKKKQSNLPSVGSMAPALELLSSGQIG